MAAVTVAELLIGVQLGGGARRKARERYVTTLLATKRPSRTTWLSPGRMRGYSLTPADRDGRGELTT
jgi:hypothetical protein